MESPGGLSHGEDVKPDTIDQLVRIRAEQHGDKAMVIDPESRISYASSTEPPARWPPRSSKPASARGRGSV
jgi:hypothetical protein